MKGETLSGGYGVSIETGDVLVHEFDDLNGDQEVYHYKVESCCVQGAIVTVFDGSGDEDEAIIPWAEINGDIGNGEITVLASENDDGTEHTIDTDELWAEIDEEELMRSAVHEIEEEMGRRMFD